MEPVNWGEAFRIVGGGLVVVFLIMSILAACTHFMGKIFINIEAKKKAAAKQAQAKEEAAS